jgi:outer membrane protein assembly factor BamD (BamD/ComL family)
MKLFKFVSLLGLILLFVAACSQTMSEDELYKLSQEQYGNEEYEKSIKTFKKLVDSYPNGKRHAEAIFMLGFINANDLKDYEAAEKHYKKFLEIYPNHELSDDAQYEIETLGKDINDLPIFKNLGADSLAE